MVVSLSQTIAAGYGNPTFGGAELEEVKGRCILELTLDSKLTFETHLPEVVSKAARSFGVVRQAEKLFNCPRVLKSCFNAYVLFSFQCGCRRLSLIWVCWIVLFAVRKDCMRMSFVVWGTEGWSVPCVCCIRFITEWTTIWMGI